jgi:DNA processing protein
VSMFGLKEAEVAELVRAVAGREHDRAAIEERFARATWTGIAEPGDRMAGLLIEKIGAVRALDVVVQRRPVSGVMPDLAGELPEADLQAGIDRWRPRVNSGAALIALRQAARLGVKLRIPGEPDWPESMAALGSAAPIALWTRGTDGGYAALAHSIALVGARAATGYGEHVTMEASAGLVDRGYAIVSGAAYGIDGMAHRAALASNGHTIAFLAGGVDRFYPSGHDALLTRIVESGAVISELPCGSTPTKWRFLQRNRLIASASLATIVVEAGWRSGSLNTAGHAAEIGRPLGAVPGPVTSAASAGCHRLIREYHAVCVTNADEMAELAPLVRVHDGSGSLNPTEESRESSETVRVLDALSNRSPRDTGDIARRCGMSVASVRGSLGALELGARVREGARGWVRLGPSARGVEN